MTTHIVDLTGVDKARKLVAVELNGTRHDIALAANWSIADLIGRINAVAPGALNIDANTGDVLTTTDITSINLLTPVAVFIDDMESYGEDAQHPDLITDTDVSAGHPGSDVLTYVSWAGPTTFGSTQGALHIGNYRVGSAMLVSGVNSNSAFQDGSGIPGQTGGTRVGSQGRHYLVSKGWTDDDGVVHDNYLPPASEGHTDGNGNPAGRYLAVDAGSVPGEYYRRAFSNVPAGENLFSLDVAASCIGNAYDNRVGACPAQPRFEVRIYEADGTTPITTLTTGAMVNDGIWKPFHLPFVLAAQQDIVVVLWNDQTQTDPDPQGNDFLIDNIGVDNTFVQPYVAVTATAVDDAMGAITVGVATNVTVSGNDTACSLGLTTYALSGGPTNGTVTLAGAVATVTAAANGAGSQDYDILCGGTVIDSATITWTGSAVTATANDDALGNVAINSPVNVNVSANDVDCSAGVTSFQLNGGATNGTASIAANVVTVTPNGVGAGSQDYNILCDGNVIDTGTISWNVLAPTATAVDDSLGAIVPGVPSDISIDLNDTGCSFGTTTYALTGPLVNGTASLAGTTLTVTATAAGAGSQSYNILCDGNIISTGTVTWTGSSVTAIAANDDMGAILNGVASTFDVSANDTDCSAGVTTRTLVGAPSNGTSSIAGGVITITPGATGAGTQDYEIRCDGNVVDTGTLNWFVTPATANAADDDAGDILIGDSLNFDIAINDTACTVGVTTRQLSGAAVNGTVTLVGSVATIAPVGVGAGSQDYEILCDGNVTSTGTITWQGAAVTADANNDDIGIIDQGVPTPVVISTNDVACSSGAITAYVLVGTPINGTISGTIPNLVITATGPGPGSQQYNITCDGAVTDTATISWEGTTPTANAENVPLGVIRPGQGFSINVSTLNTACDAGAVTTYELSGTPQNGTVTGTGPNYIVTPTSPGPGFQQYNILCNGAVADTGTITWTGETATATAVDDDLGSLIVGDTIVHDIGSNDTNCSFGATSFQLVGTAVNGTVVLNGQSVDVTPAAIGAGQQSYEILCDNVVIETGVISWTGSGVSAHAVDDNLGELPTSAVGQTRSIDVRTNDTVCNSGVTGFQLKPGSEVGCTVSDNGDGNFDFTPSGAGQFEYYVLCDNVVQDTGKVLWTFPPTATALDDVFSGMTVGVGSTVDVSLNDTPCDIGVTTYELITGSESNGQVVQVAAGSPEFIVTPGGDGLFRYNILCDGIVSESATARWSTGTNSGKITINIVSPDSEIVATQSFQVDDDIAQMPMTLLAANLQVNVDYEIWAIMETISGVVVQVSATDLKAMLVMKPTL